MAARFPEEKVRLVEETYLPGMNVSLVARQNGIGLGQPKESTMVQNATKITAPNLNDQRAAWVEEFLSKRQRKLLPDAPVLALRGRQNDVGKWWTAERLLSGAHSRIADVCSREA
jgi:hypothetical protein